MKVGEHIFKKVKDEDRWECPLRDGFTAFIEHSSPRTWVAGTATDDETHQFYVCNNKKEAIETAADIMVNGF